jgi:glycosyltransferase involved in cell wall biosynthesis
MKKLYYITSSRIPTDKAYGYAISKMCEQFGKLGLDVTLVLPNYTETNPKDLFGYYSVEETFSIMTIPAFTSQWKGFFAQISFFLRAVTFFVSVFLLRVEKNSYLYSRDLFIVPALFGKSGRVCLEIHFLQKKEKLLRCIFSYIDKIITTTEHLKNSTITFGVEGEKVFAAQDAADLAIFDIDMSKTEARRKLNLSENIPLIGYTGSLRTVGLDKGMDTLIEAIAILNTNQKVHAIAIGGSANDRKFYEKEVHKKGLDEVVMFVPRVSLDVLARYQKACDVLVMPFPNKEHFAYYMSPLKMFEYMASKRPIVSTALPAMQEILDTTTTLFFEPSNSVDMAKKIETILLDPVLAEKISNTAYAVVQMYSWEKRAARMLAFIEKK